MKTLVFCLTTLLLTGCLESGGLTTIAVPAVSVACDQDQVANCNNLNGAGKTLFLGLLRNSSVNCDSYLAQIPTGDFAAFFELSSTTITAFVGTATTGTVTIWVNTEGFGTATILDSTHQVCAFIDTNSNGSLDSNEPVADGNISPSSPSTINMWFNY